MKTISVSFLLFIALLISNHQVNAQTLISEKANVVINLLKDGEVVYTLEQGVEKEIIASSGNYLRLLTFKVDKNNPIMNFQGPVYVLEISMEIDLDGDGEPEKITDTMAVLTKSGNLKFVYLSNGAGKRLPVGWDF